LLLVARLLEFLPAQVGRTLAVFGRLGRLLREVVVQMRSELGAVVEALAANFALELVRLE
jgi:hypothetical protein